MGLIEQLLTYTALAMDAFAVAACLGLSMERARLSKALIVGLYFGVFQALMPLLGYALASRFSGMIQAYDHWIAFVLLGVIGGKMIWESFSKEDCSGAGDPPLTPRKMLPLALATSIDALAVGVSIAFLDVNIVPAVLCIGLITLLLSMVGVKIGHIFGIRLKARAEMTGGIVLVLIGVKILLEHLGVLSF